MEFDKKNMTLEEAVAIIKEIEPQHERTNSGTAESVILQAVHDFEIVPIVRCRNCVFGRVKHQDMYLCYREENEDCPDFHEPEFYCAFGQRLEK